MVALVILTATYPTALAGLGLRTPQPRDILGAVDVGAAAAALVWLGLLWCRGQWGTQDARLRQVLVLLVSLASIRGVYALLHWSAGLGPEFTLLLAGFFLLPALWVYLVPLARRRFATRRGPADRPELGELLDALDDEDSETRTGRGAQLLQTGFVLVSNSLFVYLGTFRAPVSGEVQPDFLRSDLTASAGLLLLGPPVVVLAFALRLRLQLRPPLRLRLWRRPPVRTELAVTELAVTELAVTELAVTGPAVTGPGVTRRARWLVVTGVAVTVFITAALFAVAFPRSVRASADQSYQATIPGVGCDDGDATWAILPPAPLGVACTPGALQITVAAGRTNAVSFVPPDGYFAGDYRLSVHVNFGGLASGCLTLETRVTTAGYYWANVCSQGTWTIDRSDGAVLTTLSDGLIAPAQSHTVQVTAQGASQRLAIDGRQVAVVADPRYTRTAQLVIGVQNLTGQPGQAGLSNFTFTPAGTAAPAAGTHPADRARSCLWCRVRVMGPDDPGHHPAPLRPRPEHPDRVARRTRRARLRRGRRVPGRLPGGGPGEPGPHARRLRRARPRDAGPVRLSERGMRRRDLGHRRPRGQGARPRRPARQSRTARFQYRDRGRAERRRRPPHRQRCPGGGGAGARGRRHRLRSPRGVQPRNQQRFGQLQRLRFPSR